MKPQKMKRIAIVFFLLLSILAQVNCATAQTTQTYPATSTWICPAGVTTIQVEAWGGGGAGGGNTSNSDGGGGGGGGAYSKTTNIPVTPGTSYTVTVGSGGNGGSGNGASGSDSWFKTNATILAKGGAGGASVSNGNPGNGGNGGSSTNSIGATKFAGGNGGTGRNNSSGQGGPGGSSAGTAANGTSGATTWSTVTASNAPTGGGKGGNGGTSGNDGSNGSVPGAGGGGSGDGNSDGGDGADGQIKLTWTCPTYSLTAAATATGPFCGNSSSTITLRSSSLTSGNYIVTYSLSGATNATGSTATMIFTAGSPGTGTFNTSTLLAGTTTITVTKLASEGCNNTINSNNTATVTITASPTAVAGTSINTCASAGAVNITAGSSASNQASVIWTCNGTGTFANATSLTTCTYTPSAADISAGSRILTLTAIGNGSCPNAVSTKTLIINSNPTANAGNNVSTCAGAGSVNITSGAAATNQSSVLWSSDGTGSFSNATSLTNATYNPSAADISTGSVTLTLTVNGIGGCSTAISTKTLTIIPASVGGAVSSDASVCSGSNSGVLTLSGYFGSIVKWQSSINGGSSWTDIANTTTTGNYLNLTSTTLFRAVVQNGSCATANSTPATISIIPSTIITNQPNNTTVCSGSNATFTVAANGGSLSYQWQDNSSGSFANISGANSSSLAVNSVITSMSGRQYKCIVSGTCGNATSSTVTLTVNPGSVGGTVNSSTTVCSGSNSGTLTLSGQTGSVQKWQSSTNGGTSWNDIFSTSTSRSYNNLNTTTMYRAVVQNGSCSSATSVAATITVLPSSVGGNVSSSTTVCSGSNGGTLNLNGNTGSVVKWQFSINGGSSYSDIANTTSVLNYSNLTTTTLYRAVVQNATCATANSSSATITVNSPSVGGTVNSSTSVCSGSNNGTLNLSGQTGSVQKWQSSINGGASWSDISSTSTSRTYTNLTSTTLYRAVVQNGVCAAANSNSATITVNPLPNLFTVTGGGAYCTGGTGVTIGLIGSDVGVNYQLKNGVSNSGAAMAGTGSALSFGNKTATGTYTVTATNASSCSVTMSGNATVAITAAPSTPIVSPAVSNLFPGNIQALTAQIASSNATFGTGTNTNSSTTYPAPLGTYYGGARHQILILASELSAQGIVAGEQITSLTFNVSNTNNAHAMINYTISMGATALSNLSSTFVNGLTQVYYSPSYAAVNGVNNFNFSTPFNWDGTSNIIVETVFNNNYLGTSSNPNCAVRYTTTNSFTSVNYSRADNAGAGNAPILALNSNGTSNRRPNMVLGHGVNASMIWSPITGLFTDAAATLPYTGTSASTVYAQPSATTNYSVLATLPGGCTSPSSATALVNVITTPPNCVSASVGNSSCVTSTYLTWNAASNFPSGYYVYIGTDNPPTNLVYQQDVGLATSLNLPILTASTTYYYQIAPYNQNGENTGCTVGSFVSGASASVTPSQALSYSLNFENTIVPALPCGITKSDENFPVDGIEWYSSSTAPRTGSKHLRIDKNPNNTTAKDDWFYSAPLNLTAGKLYRMYWYARASSSSKTENYEVYLSNSADAATMQSTAAVFMGNTNLLTYKLDSSSDIIPPYTGTFYFGFHANSAANAASLYVDDIQMKEIPVTALNPISCTTVSSLGDQIFCNNIYGAQDYRYRIENLNTSFSYEYERNLPIPDFRLIWAPGVLYGLTYDVSVSYKKNNTWSPYGASCPVTIGPFPIVQLKAPYCNTAISNQSMQIFTDSVAGANDYEYKIVNSTLGYDHTWSRGNSSNDYRLAWAYQYSPVLVQTLPYGYTYDVQVRALVGKTDAAHGNLPGEYGTFGTVCQLTLAGSPQTQLTPTSCGIVLTNLVDAIHCVPVPGATDYQYHIVNVADGYDQYAIRNSVSTDFRLSWIGTSSVLGVKYGTTYDISVRAKVGGIWLNFGPVCQVTTPTQPLTNLQAAYCGFTLPTFQTSVYCVPVPGATSYRYHISGPNGYDKVMDRNNASTDFKFSWTLVCCGQQNMLPNTSYQVEVAAQVGGAWSAYGSPCTITTGASVPRYSAAENNSLQSETQNDASLSVYPNPATVNQEFSIVLSGLISVNEKVSLSIRDVLGKMLYGADIITNEENRMLIKPEIKLPAGIYTVELNNNNVSYIEKLVVN